MVTLELVPLRSKYPYTGHMTLRHSVPLIDRELSLDMAINGGDAEQDILDSLEKTTTPQVAASSHGGETTVRKGVQAR
jgi:hypothetical protein